MSVVSGWVVERNTVQEGSAKAPNQSEKPMKERACASPRKSFLAPPADGKWALELECPGEGIMPIWIESLDFSSDRGTCTSGSNRKGVGHLIKTMVLPRKPKEEQSSFL